MLKACIPYSVSILAFAEKNWFIFFKDLLNFFFFSFWKYDESDHNVVLHVLF